MFGVRLCALLMTLLVFGACNDNQLAPSPPPPPPAPGVATQFMVSLSTPHSDDGAMVLVVRGPDLTDFESLSPSYAVHARLASADEARLIIIGDITDGPLITSRLAAAHEPSMYTVSLDEVAMRSDKLRADLSGYRFTITVP